MLGIFRKKTGDGARMACMYGNARWNDGRDVTVELRGGGYGQWLWDMFNLSCNVCLLVPVRAAYLPPGILNGSRRSKDVGDYLCGKGVNFSEIPAMKPVRLYSTGYGYPFDGVSVVRTESEYASTAYAVPTSYVSMHGILVGSSEFTLSCGKDAILWPACGPGKPFLRREDGGFWEQFHTGLQKDTFSNITLPLAKLWKYAYPEALAAFAPGIFDTLREYRVVCAESSPDDQRKAYVEVSCFIRDVYDTILGMGGISDVYAEDLESMMGRRKTEIRQNELDAAGRYSGFMDKLKYRRELLGMFNEGGTGFREAP